MSKGLSRIWKVVSSILLAVVVILAVLLVGVRLTGFQVFTVLSSSMEPAYHTGALLYVKEADPAEITVGTPITFHLNDSTVATHRVVEVVPDASDPEIHLFKTKGDANDVEDGGLVHQDQVIGVPRFSIPYLGYVAHYIQTPPGKYIAIAGCALILLLSFLPDLFSSEDEKKSKGKEDAKGTPNKV